MATTSASFVSRHSAVRRRWGRVQGVAQAPPGLGGRQLSLCCARAEGTDTPAGGPHRAAPALAAGCLECGDDPSYEEADEVGLSIGDASIAAAFAAREASDVHGVRCGIFVYDVSRVLRAQGTVPLHNVWRHPDGVTGLHRVPALSCSMSVH